MSGVSSLGSALASSGTSNAASPTSLLSQVGQSLLTSGSAPNASPSATTSTTGKQLTSYQSEFLTLQQQDTAELLYASFLSPEAGLANADAVLGQAAQLLGTPGSTVAAQTASTSGSTAATSASSASSTSSATSAPSLPSVASILASSDDAANATLASYGNAPAGSSIIDYQA